VRVPVRGEPDAFHITIGGAALIGASVAVGAIAGEAAGVALFAGGFVGAAIWEISARDPDGRLSLREAASEGARTKPMAARRRVLVIANRTLAGQELRAVLRRRGTAGAELHVVAPILASRVHYVASDLDRELEEARARLGTMLAWADAEGLDATGKVGDPNAALGAIEDELRLFGADEVIISTYPTGKSNWLETGIVERLREELDIPVTHVIVATERGAVPASR
jgi:GABA permease